MLGTGGLYAPTIRHHDGVVYVVCTNIVITDKSLPDRSENFIVSTRDIWSDEWSDPVYFDFRGIDPSIFFDGDGRSYIQGSAAPGPMTEIHLFEIDLSTGNKLSEQKKIWGGTGGIYPEGPHLYKKDGWYYLLISEGGTHEDHMITAARSRDIWGPYESYENNPILTARGTDEYIQYTGHCDMFQDQKGAWWGVCLGVRKDKGNRFIMGRETFLTPGRWSEGSWPSLERVVSSPNGLARDIPSRVLAAKPMVDYLYIRDADLRLYKFASQGSAITLTSSSIDLEHPTESPTFVGKRQRRLDGSSTVTVVSSSQLRSGSTKAGLACYKDEHRYFKIFYDNTKVAIVFEMRNNAKKIHRISTHSFQLQHTVDLRIQYSERDYRLSFKDGQDASTEWHSVGSLDTLDMTDPDFVGPVVGIFAVADGNSAEIEFCDLAID